MFLIPQQIPWTQQPQFSAGIDWSNPITRGLIFAVSGVGPDVVSGQQGVALPSGKQGVTKNGVAVESTSTTDGGYYYPLSKHIPNSLDDVTLFQTVEIDSWDGYSGLLTIPAASGTWSPPFGAFGLQRYAALNNLRMWGSDGATGAISSIDVSAGNAYSIGVSKSGSSVIFDINGIRESVSLTPVVYDLSVRQPICLLQRSNSNNGEGVEGRSAITLMWKRALSAAELRLIRENPWQIFAPQTEYLFIPTIAGGGPANITGTLSSTLESINTAIQGSLGHGGTLSISLDTIAITGSGVLNHIGTSTSTLDDVVVTFSGAVDTAGSVSGILACTLDNIVFSSTGNLNHSTTITFTLDDIFVSLAGTVAGTPENIDGTMSIVLDGIGFTSSGNSGTLTLTDDDINAIMTAIINNPKTLTVPKFLGLK